MKSILKIILIAAIIPLVSSFVFANDPAKEFSIRHNPNGLWRYGYSQTLSGPFALFTGIHTNGWQPRDDSWYAPELNRGFDVNFGRDLAENYTTPDRCGFEPPGVVRGYPGSNGEYAVLRWTAPLTGHYNIRGYWQGNQGGDFCQSYQGNFVDVHVLLNTDNHLLDKNLSGFAATVFFNFTQLVDAGATLDFSQGWGERPGSQYPHGANLQLTIDYVPRVQVLPMVNRQISLAILSDDYFSAPSMVARGSITFGRIGTELTLIPVGVDLCTVQDVNHDHYLDLVCRFDPIAAGFMPGDTEAILQGVTHDGVTLRTVIPFHW
jgi:hypothetical protein